MFIKNCFNYSKNDNPDFLNIHDCFEVIRGFNYIASHLEKVKNNKNQNKGKTLSLIHI